jgi:hypothetical protein
MCDSLNSSSMGLILGAFNATQLLPVRKIGARIYLSRLCKSVRNTARALVPTQFSRRRNDMQRRRVRAPIAFAVLLTLAGCTGGSPPSPAPAAATPPPPPNMTLGIWQDENNGYNPEVHAAALADGSTITWTSTVDPFHVVFPSGANPCDHGNASPQDSNAYYAIPASDGHSYTTFCKLIKGQGTPPYAYEIYFDSPHGAKNLPKHPYHHPTATISHCEGCVIDSPQ